MKAFIFALTSQDEVPEKVICYNSGAYLTTEDPDTVKDLKSLEEAGATVMTCVTCLDFYGLKEKLKVGIISNMYDIVEAQMSASLLIRP
jgi:selenium metabolism protein YedF